MVSLSSLFLQETMCSFFLPEAIIRRPVNCTTESHRPQMKCTLITDEEYLAQLETKREEITHEILERCRTKRKNLYITGPVALNVAQKFSVHRLCDKEGKHMSI